MKKAEVDLLFATPARNDNAPTRTPVRHPPDSTGLLRQYIRMREAELDELRRELRAAEGLAAAGRN